MPLSFAEKGNTLCVKRVRGKDDVRQFLANLGFVEGSNITVVSEAAGNLIVSVKDTRVAISKEMAGRIMV